MGSFGMTLTIHTCFLLYGLPVMTHEIHENAPDGGFLSAETIISPASTVFNINLGYFPAFTPVSRIVRVNFLF